MSYFSDHYNALSYPVARDGQEGLYNAQIGAIHSVGSHFTINDDPAIVTMPTGSGKTAVLMMSPFVLQCRRGLVITPSVMVRGQIAEEFQALDTLIKIGVLPDSTPRPKVYEVRKRITSAEEWAALDGYDVVVSTPSCASPAYETIPTPPEDLFDLLLIDEAHHSPAHTWKELLAAFPSVKRILFTATPYRRDRAEIRGKFIFSYPVARAYQDKIFGQIEYVPTAVHSLTSESDIEVAKKAEEILKEDRDAGFNHFVMVRTDGLKRSGELSELYKEHTNLRLEVVTSRRSNRRAKKAIQRLRDGELDGIICVNMLGEGFNFTNLKIAAIHAPHKSLEVTLQFIGRFARTNAPDIGSAKFVAALHDIELEGERLFQQGSVWQDIVVGLSHERLEAEVQSREVLQEFDEPEAEDLETRDISLYGLRPRSHVKIYEVSDNVDIGSEFELKAPFEVYYRNVNRNASAALVVTQEVKKPRWSHGDQLLDVSYELFIVYFDKQRRLLFINSSRSIDGLYDSISKAFDASAKPLAMSQVSRVAKDITNQAFFNIGMRNIRAANNAESYRILAGSNTGATIRPSDSRSYRQGHAFLAGDSEGKRVTIGYSSGGKVWSSSTFQIPALLEWCRMLGAKIRSQGEVVTQSGIDYLSVGAVATELPTDLVYVQWDKDAFNYSQPVRVKYASDSGTEILTHISELDLRIDFEESNSDRLRVKILGEGIEYAVEFTFDDFFYSVDGNNDRIMVLKGEHESTIIEYLNERYLDFYSANGSLFRGNEIFVVSEPSPPISLSQIEVVDWTDVDLTHERGAASPHGKSIHAFLRERLESDEALEVIFYDDGTGEIADFVTLSRADEFLYVRFYHCKASGQETPGARINDLYEVCGQAQKSLFWTLRIGRLFEKIDMRKHRSEFVRGSIDTVKELLQETTLRKSFEIIVVQPGISKAGVSDAMLENLGATSDHIQSAGCAPLRVYASD